MNTLALAVQRRQLEMELAEAKVLLAAAEKVEGAAEYMRQVASKKVEELKAKLRRVGG